MRRTWEMPVVFVGGALYASFVFKPLGELARSDPSLSTTYWGVVACLLAGMLAVDLTRPGRPQGSKYAGVVALAVLVVWCVAGSVIAHHAANVAHIP